MRKVLFVAAALVPLSGLPASAALCPNAPALGTYSTVTGANNGFSCEVDGLTFSNFTLGSVIHDPLSLGASVSFGNIFPYIAPPEFGLTLNLSAFAPAGTSVDVIWQYTVAGNLINDAFLQAVGGTTGNGSFSLSEILSNGTTLFCFGTTGGCSDSKTFAPIASLTVLKDLFTFGGSRSETFTQISGVTNAFSLTAVPIPGAVGLFATGLGMLGVLGWRKKRNTKAFA